MAMALEVPRNSRDMDLLSATAENPTGVPPGNYALVGWAIDTTGRRLIDEICQLAAYTPTSSFVQYIMPYGDLNPGARRRHQLRVVTVGRYRMLKETVNHTIIKTKSEVNALVDFMNWLEKMKGDNDRIILIYHEPRRSSPTMMLEALNRYSLVGRFRTIVAGFADNYAFCKETCQISVNTLSLRRLVRNVLNDDRMAVNTAHERATAAYKIMESLAQEMPQEFGPGGEGGSSGHEIEQVCKWTRSVESELEALRELKSLLARQNTYRAIFVPLLRSSLQERKRYTYLRRLLADAGILYEQMRDAWHEEKIAGLRNLMSPLALTCKEEDIEELVDIFDRYFDPHKEPKRANRKEKNSFVSLTFQTNAVKLSDVFERMSTTESDSSHHMSPSASFSGALTAQDLGDF